jgi:hypothetical protein
MPSVGAVAFVAARAGAMYKKGAKTAAINSNNVFLFTLMLHLFYLNNKKTRAVRLGFQWSKN